MISRTPPALLQSGSWGRKKLVKKTPHVLCVKQDSNSNTSGCEQETSPIPEKQESSPAPIPDLDCLPGSSSLPLCDPEKLQRVMRQGKRRGTPYDRPVDQESSSKSRKRSVETKAKASLIDLVSFSPISEKQGSSPILTLVSIPVPSPTSVREAETCRQRQDPTQDDI
uniref:Uncharacterized protein n=1 Tax=Knipowitschia caucasica TaxID=637954 RepID=A0AAV2LPU9_KNICA